MELYRKGGPSTRRVIDFFDIENSWSILPTGQSIHLVRITATKQRFIMPGNSGECYQIKMRLLELQQIVFYLVKLIVYKELRNINQ
jgi:hypothetical protein